MAATITWDGFGVVDSADATTNWTALKISGTGGGPSAAVADGSIEGTNAVTTTVSKQRVVLYADIGVGNELDFTGGGAEEGQLVYIWVNFLAASLLFTKANAGLAIYLGSSAPTTTLFTTWYMEGSDTYAGGWKRLVLDPTSAISEEAGTTIDLSAVRYFGVMCDVGGVTLRFDNLVIDSISVGNGLIVTGTSVSELNTELLADEATNSYGVIQSLNDSDTAIGLLGKITIGDDTGTGATVITDSLAKHFIAEPLYDLAGVNNPAVPLNSFGISCVGNATGATTITMGTKVGSGATASGISGISVIGNPTYNAFITWDDGNVNTNKWYGCSLENLTGDLVWADSSTHECIGNSFTGCSTFKPVGAVIIRGCNFIAFDGPPTNLTASILWNESIDISNCNFIANDTLEVGTTSSTAIEHPVNTGTPYTHTNLIMSGNTKDVAYSEWFPDEERVDRFSDDVRATVVSPDGVWVTFGGASAGSADFVIKQISDWSTVTNPSTLPGTAINGAAFNHDGTLFAVAGDGTPFVYIYDTTTSPWTKFADPATLPAGIGLDVAFSNDGGFLAVAHTSTPFVTIYESSGHASGWTKVTNPATLPSSNARACDFSPDSRILAVLATSSTYGRLYNTTDWTSTVLPNISSRGNALRFSPNGAYMALAQNNAPRLLTYTVNEDRTITAFSDATTLPGGTGRDVHFSADDLYCAIGHNSSPYISIYKTGTNPWVKQTNPLQLPVGSGGVGGACGFDHENYRLYVGSFDSGILNTTIAYQNAETIDISKIGTSNASTSRGPNVGLNLSVTITVTVKDKSQTVLSGIPVYISTDEAVKASRTELLNVSTNVSGVATTSFDYISDQGIIVWVRSSTTGTRYKNFSTVGTIESTGFSLAVTLEEDAIVT